MGDQIYFWNRPGGEGFCVTSMEGSWHGFVNVFAAVVESEEDCRDAEYTSSLAQSGSTKRWRKKRW